MSYYTCDFNHPRFPKCNKIINQGRTVHAFMFPLDLSEDNVKKHGNDPVKVVYTCSDHTWWGMAVTGSYDPPKVRY